MTKKLIAEFIGTFFLLLIVALTENPIAIGIGLTALVYMGGYISGAHYNPAVTLALFINKKITASGAGAYMLTQFIAAIFASYAYFLIHGNHFIPQMGKNSSFTSAFLIELLFTFLLASVVLHVAVTDKTKGNNYFGIAIGFTLGAAAFAGGTISGGAFNPAVGVGPLLFDITHAANHGTSFLLYLLGPFIGGTLAGTLYKRLLSSKTKCNT